MLGVDGNVVSCRVILLHGVCILYRVMPRVAHSCSSSASIHELYAVTHVCIIFALLTNNVYCACRADIKQYIGLPSAAAIFKIYHSCIQELMRVQ